MRKISGITHLRIDGVLKSLKGECEVMYQTFTNETIVGEDEVHGYSQTPVAPSIKMNITNRGDIDFAEIMEKDEMTIQLSMNNGQTITLTGAHVEGEVTHGTKENEVSITFKGNSIVITEQ